MEVESSPNPPAVCYICYETQDKSGQATIRNCYCRGTLGYVHQSCLIKYLIHQQPVMEFIPDKRVINKRKLVSLLTCSICKKRYRGELYTDLLNGILDHYHDNIHTVGLASQSTLAIVTSEL